jgi:hypothetical protein
VSGHTTTVVSVLMINSRKVYEVEHNGSGPAGAVLASPLF